MGNNMLTLQADNMDQFFQWDAEGTLGTTRRYSLSLRTTVAGPRKAGPGGGSSRKWHA